MSSTPRVSVCVATYRGARYVREQIDSILVQLGPEDEIVVVDDASPDETWEVLHSIGDPRLRLHRNAANAGYVRTFERALTLASGDVLLLSDQDDVWTPEHVRLFADALRGADVAASNLATLGGPRRIRSPFGHWDWRLHSRGSRRNIRNVVGVFVGNMPYHGCAMGLTRDGLARAVPFPSFLYESHDLYLALLGNCTRSIAHIDERTVLRRFHDANTSSRRPRGIRGVLRSRRLLLHCLAHILREARR